MKFPLTVILGPDELASGNVRLKVSSQPRSNENGAEAQDSITKGEKDRGLLVPKDNLVVEVKGMLQEIRSGR